MILATTSEFYDFIEHNKQWIEGVRVTSCQEVGFNDMEGTKYEYGVKIITKQGWKNKQIKVSINSSYLEISELSDTDFLKEYIENLAIL